MSEKDYSTSAIDESGQLYEMFLERNSHKTGFITLLKGNKIERCDSVLNGDSEILPFHPENGLVKNNFVKFPSQMTSYSSELKLFEEIKNYIKKYVQIPDSFVEAASVYVMMTWIYDQFGVVPYLRVIGNFGVGKSRFLEVVGNVCYKPMFVAGSLSIASVFRTIDSISGTLIFDEADFKITESWSEIVKIFNTGHTNTFPVTRMESNGSGKNFTTKAFKVFGPKVIGSRERFGDEALESRCLSYTLFPIKNVKCPVHLPKNFEDESLSIRNKLLTFRFKHLNKVDYEKTEIGSIGLPSLKQSFLSIIYTVRLINEKVLNNLVEFAKSYEKELESNQSTTVEADILECIGYLLLDKGYMKQHNGRIGINEIAKKFNDRYYHVYGEKDERGLGPMGPSFYRVSPRKIGDSVRRKLNIRVERDRLGYYIPSTENQKINSLLERYGLNEKIVEDLKQTIVNKPGCEKLKP